MERDQLRLPNTNLVCPVFVDQICAYLENHGLTLEGILRVPGNSQRVKVKWLFECVIFSTVTCYGFIFTASFFVCSGHDRRN